jgi:cytochrome c oxidase cbb3-type subunit 4
MYETLRQLADSWALVIMVVVFIAVVVFVFRPGSKKQYDRASQIPLKNGDKD